ncbi:sugar ABC transporter substrate-binding protein [Mesorhizobium sp. M0088]|uniref:sugar ABC transporter substrate-binding protein n=1 Tax=Mesorhizobium sp. M0088 TaxID=2956873 RepID=UPI003339DA1F
MRKIKQEGFVSAFAGVALATMVGASAYAQSADKPLIGFTSTALTNPYTITFHELIQGYGKAHGYNVLPTVDSNSDAAKQIDDMTTMISAGVKGILLETVDGKAVKVALDRAEAAGVKVVAVDTGPDQGGGKVAITVTVSSYVLGQRSCEQLGKIMDGKGKVLEIQGRLNNQVGVDRSAGFNDCIKKNFPAITVVSKPGEWIEDKATTAAQTVLSTDPAVNGIYLASDSAYLPGVLNVMKRLGRLSKVGESGHVPIVGIDGSPFALEQIRDGFLDATIGQPMTAYTEWGFKYLDAAMQGKTFSPGPTDHGSEIVVDKSGNLADVLPPTTITAENAGDSSLWGNQGQNN